MSSDNQSTFREIPLAGLSRDQARKYMRLNCLGSLFYFIKVALRRKKLTKNFHRPICQGMETDHIKDVFEIPRDHFKSTIGSEGLPMWRVLPVDDEDRDGFTKLGYSSEFIKWIDRSHRSWSRNLLVSENITNAAALGRRISHHYESNAVFRMLFPEIIPTSSEMWSAYSLHHRIPSSNGAAASGGHGEGTFDFLGVGGALQSRHYDGIVVEDDLVGRKAIESPSIMEKTIDYHKLVVGAFESDDIEHDNDELIIGNRWGYIDLNSHIVEHEPWFKIHTHSALGGCCPEHPMDTLLCPEIMSFEKLEQYRERLGNYLFSCQFLNNPAAPENADFHSEDLNYYNLVNDPVDGWVIKHEVHDGIVTKDIKVSDLSLALVTDPNHSGNSGLGRCRHSICVVGLSSTGNYYLVDCWALGISLDAYINKIYEIADKWSLTKVGVETVAAQKYLKNHIDYRNRLEGRYMRIVELKGEVDTGDGEISRRKEFRIRGVLAPIFEFKKFWTQRRFQDFYGEFTTFPKGRYCDILDALAYAPQMLKLPMSFMNNMKWRSHNASFARKVMAKYAIGA